MNILQAATVSGVVTDGATSGNLEGVIVQLRSAGGGGGGGGTIGTDTTGTDGAFSFTGVNPGRYTVRATKTGYVTGSVADTVDSAETESVVAIVLAPIVNTTISGTVTDSAAGTPVAGAVVQLRSGNQPVGTDTTDAEGKYSFGNVATGTYTVRGSKTGYATKTLTVAATSADPVSVDIPLVGVVMTTVSGTVTDSVAGTLVAGAVVQLRSGNQTIGTDTTDAEGKYSFAEVATGTYSVRGSKTGYASKTLAVAAASAEPVTVDIPLVGVVVTTVSGTVSDSAAGMPVAGAVVQLRSGNQMVGTDTTDAEGKYSFAEVETGTYSVRGAKTGYVTKTLAAAVASAEPVMVDIPLVAVVMTTVSGTVTDSVAGTPVAGAVVQLRRGNQTVGTDTTDAEGKYSFVEVETGTYSVRGAKTGYVTKTLAAPVASAEPVTVDIPLIVAVLTTVSGTVTDSAAGTPVAGAVVQLRSGNQTVATDTTGSDGKYTFTEVETGRYTVRVSAGSFITTTVTDTVASTSADTTTIDVKMRKGGAGIVDRNMAVLTGSPGVVMRGGFIIISGVRGTGVVQVFNLNGKMLLQRSFTSTGNAVLSVPQLTRIAETVLLVKIAGVDGRAVVQSMVSVLR